MSKCLVCGKELENRIVSFSNMPKAAQHMPTKDQLNQEKGMELDLFQCAECGLVQFDCEPVDYYRDVIRAGGFSDKMVKLRKEQYQRFIERFALEGKKIWEVGCGAGEFLKIMRGFPVDCFGVEHNDELVKQALMKGLAVKKGFVGSESYIAQDGLFDGFLSFNFLEHQPNPNGMLRGIYNNLSEGGVGLVTVPSFEYFMEHSSYYEFLRDHLANYTQESLTFLMIKNGFDVIECTRFNDDTLEMLVKKRKPVTISTFNKEKEMLESSINSSLHKNDLAGEIAVWGASHQAFTLLSTLTIDFPISYVIDSAPFKWGYYTPASHIPIVSPEILKQKNITSIIIMAPGYSDEIFKTIVEKKSDIKQVLSVKGERVLELK